MDVNLVVVCGNITRDPDLRTTPAGTSVCDFGLAVNDHWKDKDGKKQERVDFFDVTAWGKTAETINKFMSKGSLIHVTGKLRFESWEAKDGGKRSKVRIIAESVSFGPKRDGAGKQSANDAADEMADRKVGRQDFDDAPAPAADETVPF